MPDEPSLILFVIVIIFSLGLGFTNGINDAANAIATAVGTRVLSPRAAVSMAAVFNFAGAFTGIEVAKTIGKGILPSADMTEWLLIAAAASVIIWGVLCTRFGLPISLSHSLVAGLLGAGIATAGWSAIQWDVMTRVLAAVAIAPVLGFAGGFILMAALMWIFRYSTPTSIRNIFGNLQILSSAFMAYSHGKNDGQMPIGIMMAALVLYNNNPLLWEEGIPWWVIAVGAASISLGTALGGWRVMRTLSTRITTLRPVHGFAAQSSAAAVIETASHLGIPVSTTHSISSSIMGVGATRRLSAVRWGVAGNMVAAWVITFPVCVGLGWILGWTFKSIF